MRGVTCCQAESSIKTFGILLLLTYTLCMRTIELTQGQATIVDDTNYAWLSSYKWHAHKRRPRKDGAIRYDAVRSYGVRMTHTIMLPAPYHSVHHKNGDPLDNREENLVCMTYEAHLSLHGKQKSDDTQDTGEKPCTNTKQW